MKEKICSICGSKMKKNGKTKTGSQRWRCKRCGSSSTHTNNTETRELKLFLNWLFSKDVQQDMPGEGRTFRRKVAKFWEVWPMPELVDEIHRVIFVDGIYLGRNTVILIACSELYVLSWYLARAETSYAWEALLSRIAPPDMVVSDGGSGFSKAVKKVWPNTLVQRCLFHVHCQIKRCTTTRPRLQAGKEIYQLSIELMHINTLKQAESWVDRFMEWCEFWEDFLNESHWIKGRKEYEHERLRKARRSIVKLIRDKTLFNYLDLDLTKEGKLPHTNNLIEGSINAQLRDLLRNHRGLSTIRRIKAVYWWCYVHTECPHSAPEILRIMPKDTDIEVLEKTYGQKPHEVLKPQKWGEGIVWNEFHNPTPYPYSID